MMSGLDVHFGEKPRDSGRWEASRSVVVKRGAIFLLWEAVMMLPGGVGVHGVMRVAHNLILNAEDSHHSYSDNRT